MSKRDLDYADGVHSVLGPHAHELQQCIACGVLGVFGANSAWKARLPSLIASEDIDGLLSTTVRSATDGKVVARDRGLDLPLVVGERRVPMSRIYAEYAAGATVVINSVERRLASVAALCQAIERDLGRQIEGNCYLTPASGQGFDEHADVDDVLVLQVEGSKSWCVGSAPSMNPDVRVELSPGDCFYLPKGHRHFATALGAESSLHLTLGLKGGAVGVPFSETLLGGGHGESVWETLDLVENRARVEMRRAWLARSVARAGQFRCIDSVSALDDDTVITKCLEGPSLVSVVGGMISIEFAGGCTAEVPCSDAALAVVGLVLLRRSTCLRELRSSGGGDSSEADRIVRSLIVQGYVAQSPSR